MKKYPTPEIYPECDYIIYVSKTIKNDLIMNITIVDWAYLDNIENQFNRINRRVQVRPMWILARTYDDMTPERDKELRDLDCFLELALRKRYKTYDEFHEEFGNFVYESEERYLMYFEESNTFDVVTTQELKTIYNSVKRYKPA